MDDLWIEEEGKALLAMTADDREGQDTLKEANEVPSF